MRSAIAAILLSFASTEAAYAQATPPERRIPPAVLGEVSELDGRFETTLYADCDPTLCFAKGCTYVDHAVSDRPRNASLPGLGQDVAPSVTEVQEVLTRATCAFAYEDAVPGGDAQALARRLQDKLSSGWLTVQVTPQRLLPLPDSLQPAEPEDTDPDTAPPPPVEPEKPPLSLARAVEELWTQLLPHTWWMVAVALGTLALTVLIWAARRMGADSLEDRLLLAEAGQKSADDPPPPAADPAAAGRSPEDEAYVVAQEAAWRAKFAEVPARADVQALLRELLLRREFDLLAQAALRFPDSVPAAFPEGVAGGGVSSAKLAFAEHLTGLDTATRTDDLAFFRALNRHALSASIANQGDAQTLRSLRDDFGSAGLAAVIDEVPSRTGALLFALAAPGRQEELVRLLEPATLARLADSLLRSNRVSPSENQHLLDVLAAARAEAPLPRGPEAEVSDRGEGFDAAGPLSVLLEAMNPDRRAALFAEALERGHGALPDWTRGIVTADLLLRLEAEARADLFLEVEPVAFSAWIGLLDRETADALLAGAPSALRTTVRASAGFPDRDAQIAAAQRARVALARGYQAILSRSGGSFWAELTEPQGRA